MWGDVLGPELLTRPRLSRIYYRMFLRLSSLAVERIAAMRCPRAQPRHRTKEPDRTLHVAASRPAAPLNGPDRRRPQFATRSDRRSDVVRRYSERTIRQMVIPPTREPRYQVRLDSGRVLYQTLACIWFRHGVLTCGERKHNGLGESRMREIRTSGLTSGIWKRRMVRLEAPITETPGTDRLNPNYRATS